MAYGSILILYYLNVFTFGFSLFTLISNIDAELFISSILFTTFVLSRDFFSFLSWLV